MHDRNGWRARGNRGLAGLLSGIAVGLLCQGASAADMTADRQQHPDREPQNWLMVHKNYAATRYSSLDQINRANVGGLKVAYTVGLTGSEAGGAPVRWPNGTVEATPLVEDGFMYFANGWDVVYKIDLHDPTQGKTVWRTDPGIDKSTVEMPVNRGVAFYKNFLIVLTGNGHLLEIKKDNGRIVSDDDIRTAPTETFTAAPLVIGDKVIVGASGGDMGARDWLGAWDLANHRLLWKWNSVPAKGEKGGESWQGDPAKIGGGAIWITGAYDPESNRLFWGVGNPAPMFDRAIRPGDNLYTESTVAIDADTGKLDWYFQYTPNDAYDFDDAGAQMLLTLPIGGKDRAVLSHWSRNGFYYNLDRKTGAFINGGPYLSNVNWTKGLDQKTGKPLEYDASKALQSYLPAADPKRNAGPVSICPDSHGGVNYWPPAWSPLTKRTYAGAIEGCFTLEVDPEKSIGGSTRNPDPTGGSLIALDPTAVRVEGRHMTDVPDWSGAVATAGHLVFTAFLDGTVVALDDESMKPLYTFHAGTYIAAPPIAYAVDGKEYVAILSGGPISPRIQGPKAKIDLNLIDPAPMLYVFSL